MPFIFALFAFGAVLLSLGGAPAATRTHAHGQAVVIPEILRQAGPASGRDLRSHIERAFQTLIDAEAARDRGETAAGRRVAVRKAADRIFDWPEMAKDALGKHWTHATSAQRERIVRLFPQLFERLYLPIFERTGPPKATRINEAVVFVGEAVDGNDAVVRMMWRRSARDLPVDWSMRRRAGAWRIRDVTLDGISVVDNYRAQFDHVIQRSSHDELLARMEAKASSPLPAPLRVPVPERVTSNPRPELTSDLP
ncbi:MAG: MlaC/ttg2D family ABC transporter substrate-binding protein [Gammaproteobacteria bacterium]